MSREKRPATIPHTRVASGSQREPAGWTFFRQWLKNPLAIAAISPSSRHLARQMVGELPAGTQRVIELGGGTGVFTQALIDHGVAPADLLVLELNQELHHHLVHRFHGVRVVCADARDLVSVTQRTGFLEHGQADAVISGLGLLSMPKPMQQEIVQAAFDCLRPDGRLIQFTYGPGSPIAREVLDALGIHARRGNMAWWNVPPATVYVYTRNKSRAVKARSMR